MNPQSYMFLKYKMGNSAKILGIVSIAVFIVLPTALSLFISFGLGCMALLIAFLSKGYEQKLDRNAKIGSILGTIAVCVSLLIIAVSFYILLSNPEYLKESLQYAESVYGEDYRAITGQDFSSSLNEFLGGLTNGN